jgi:hypothetical protein
MAEKTLNTRVLLKHDTLANWNNASSITLKKGEVAITTVETKQTNANGAIVTVPVTLMKVGDGEKKFSALPWVSALAADVHAWAKENALYFDLVGEGNAITNVEWDITLNGGKGGLKFTKGETFATKEELEAADTNTQYKFSIPTTGDDAGKLLVEKKEIGETAWTKVDAYDFVTPGELTEILKGYYTKTEIDTKLGSYALKSELHAPTTVAEGSGISVTGTDRNYIVSHDNTSDAVNLVADGRKYVTGLTFDDFGHVTGYTTGTEADQDLGNYYTKDETYNKTEVDNLV